MTVTPLPIGGGRGVSSRANRLVGSGAMRRAPSRRAIARRRRFVAFFKTVLPLAACALLATIALWPELTRQTDHSAGSLRKPGVEAQSGEMKEASYHGLDSHSQPYAVTASVARQVAPDRIDLTEPKGDLSLTSGSWLFVRSKQGVYLQHENQLDLSGDVNLYRDDGTTLQTDSAAVDLKEGAALGTEMVHVEGPFGVLDAQGFALVDRGASLQFAGPGHMVLNGGRQK